MASVGGTKMTEEHKKYIKKRKVRKCVIVGLQAGILLLFIGAWELVAYLKIVDPFIISSPSRIVKIIGELYRGSNLFPHIFATLYETVLVIHCYGYRNRDYTVVESRYKRRGGTLSYHS